MIVENTRYKNPSSYLGMGNHEPYTDGNGYTSVGHYYCGNGVASVRINTREYSMPGFDYKTSIDFNYKGYLYNRRYNCLFSDRGLMLICNRLIKDVINNKFKIKK